MILNYLDEIMEWLIWIAAGFVFAFCLLPTFLYVVTHMIVKAIHNGKRDHTDRP